MENEIWPRRQCIVQARSGTFSKEIEFRIKQDQKHLRTTPFDNSKRRKTIYVKVDVRQLFGANYSTLPLPASVPIVLVLALVLALRTSTGTITGTNCPSH
jgi:hypothetical protein